jgi:hypothetical protein
MSDSTERTTFFIATQGCADADKVAQQIISLLEVNIDQWLKSDECDIIESDRDSMELAFAMSEKYQRKLIEGPTSAYSIRVSVEARPIPRHKKVLTGS